jgi:hypothetical protein
LRIHSSKPVRIRFNRCNAAEFVAVHTIEAAASSQPRRMDRWRGCDWKASAALPPDTLAPGFYRLDVEHRDDAARVWGIRALMRWFNVRWRLADRHWLFAVPLPERRPNAHIHHALLGHPGAPAADVGPGRRSGPRRR